MNYIHIHILIHYLESIKTRELTNIIVDKFECYFQVMKLETEETWTLETAGQIPLESHLGFAFDTNFYSCFLSIPCMGNTLVIL